MTLSDPAFPWAALLTAVGVIVSLAWNVFNTWFAHSIKKQDRRLDEFKRLRARVDAAVDELRGTTSSLVALQNTSSKQDFGTKLKALNLELAQQDQKISIALNDLERSHYVHLKGWPEMRLPLWDEALAALNGGYNTTKSLVEQKRAVKACVRHLNEMVSQINQNLEEELVQYASRPRRKRVRTVDEASLGRDLS